MGRAKVSRLNPKDQTGYDNSRQDSASPIARRCFLMTAGVGLAMGVTNRAHADCDSDDTFEIYNESTRFELHGKGDQIIQNAYDLGYRFHKKHGGCARCVVAALQKALEMVPNHPGLFRTATCLDAGAAPGQKLSCGCFTGAGIVIGYICGGENFKSRSLAHGLIQQVAKIFQDNYGSVLCEDAIKDNDCSDLVGLTCKWTAEILLKQFSDYTTDT